MSQRRIWIVGTAVAAVVCAAVLLVSLPATRIWWHERQMARSLEAALAGDIGRRPGWGPVEKMEYHRQALVSLGHLRHEMVELEHVTVGSNAYRELVAALRNQDNVRPAWEIPHRDPVVIHLFVPPTELSHWRDLIRRVDREAASGDK